MRQALRKAKRRRKTVLHIIIALIIILLAMIIIGNQQSIMIMQVDTLNTLNNMQIVEAIEPPPEESQELQTEPQVLAYEERELIYRVVAAEARGENIQGMMAVAQVIRDRSTAWDMPVTDVLTAPGQFAAPYRGIISDEVKLAVANVFDGQMNILEVPTTHFHAEYVAPNWSESKVNRGKVGRHEFWY